MVVDDLSNSRRSAVDRVETITGRTVHFHELDLRDTDQLAAIFAAQTPEAVIHLAGLKAVGESVAEPVRYYDTNLGATLSLLKVMAGAGVYQLIFSSSATVYGIPEALPLTEEARIGQGVSNPYAWSKFMIEQILRDLAATDPRWQISLLRYFNPVGAHPSGLIGEDPAGLPNNLMPFVSQVAIGQRDEVLVFGDDYETIDGTGVRDYLHVVDLAQGHLAALNHLTSGVATYNLGTGTGSSVLQIIAAYSAACGRELPYRIVDRRPGDLASSYCSPAKAEQELGWRAKLTIADTCQDSWRWQSTNPLGYPL
jgi:UDP-glucose 4-epimerase